MANKVLDICYDEKLTAKSILSLDDNRRKLMRRFYLAKHYTEFFVLIIKYLISQGKTSDDIKSILKKHTALFIYYCDVYYYKGNKKEILKYDMYKIEEFDELLNQESIDINYIINIESKARKTNPYYILYISNDYKEIKQARLHILKNEKNDTARENEGYLLKTLFDYFFHNCRFKSNPVNAYGHIDLAIAYCLNNPRLKCFSFSAKDDLYDTYWIKKSDPVENIIKEQMLGYVINLIFENNNLDYTKHMKVNNEYYYNIMLGIPRVKTIRSAYKFFNVDEEGYATIDKSILNKEFSFIYNNKEYLLTKKGIIEK